MPTPLICARFAHHVESAQIDVRLAFELAHSTAQHAILCERHVFAAIRCTCGKAPILHGFGRRGAFSWHIRARALLIRLCNCFRRLLEHKTLYLLLQSALAANEALFDLTRSDSRTRSHELRRNDSRT